MAPRSLRDLGKAEANNAGAESRRASKAGSRPQEAPDAVPRAATQHTLAPIRAYRINNFLVRHIATLPIRTPLPDIAMHLIQPPGIRLKFIDRRGAFAIYTGRLIVVRLSAIEVSQLCT